MTEYKCKIVDFTEDGVIIIPSKELLKEKPSEVIVSW